MDAQMQELARDAIARLDHVLEHREEIGHTDVQAATNAIIAFRNCVIESGRENESVRACLDRANSIVSLAFGAEFPLSGMHFKRFEQTREGMLGLLRDFA